MAPKPLHLHVRVDETARKVSKDAFEDKFSGLGDELFKKYLRVGRKGLLRSIDGSEKLYRRLLRDLLDRLLIDREVLRQDVLSELDRKTIRAYRASCWRRYSNLRISTLSLTGKLLRASNEVFVLVDEIDLLLLNRFAARFGIHDIH
ncbi:MAG: hypothetical protein JWN50_802 [Parcubacteria group bacterium]|nr:hypothetical protein [Parcubacteria group bacterium]